MYFLFTDKCSPSSSLQDISASVVLVEPFFFHVLQSSQLDLGLDLLKTLLKHEQYFWQLFYRINIIKDYQPHYSAI